MSLAHKHRRKFLNVNEKFCDEKKENDEKVRRPNAYFFVKFVNQKFSKEET